MVSNLLIITKSDVLTVDNDGWGYCLIGAFFQGLYSDQGRLQKKRDRHLYQLLMRKRLETCYHNILQKQLQLGIISVNPCLEIWRVLELWYIRILYTDQPSESTDLLFLSIRGWSICFTKETNDNGQTGRITSCIFMKASVWAQTTNFRMSRFTGGYDKFYFLF